MITARIASNRKHNLIRPTADMTVDMRQQEVGNTAEDIALVRRLAAKNGWGADVLAMLGIDGVA